MGDVRATKGRRSLSLRWWEKTKSSGSVSRAVVTSAVGRQEKI